MTAFPMADNRAVAMCCGNRAAVASPPQPPLLGSEAQPQGGDHAPAAIPVLGPEARAAIGMARPELVQVADTVARDKGIDREEVFQAMEQAIQKAGRSKYGHENDIRAVIDRKNGEIRLARYLTVVEAVEDENTQLTLEKAKRKGHPHAVALLYKIYQEPYLIEQADPIRAEGYRQAYGELDVARSGYPSFDKSLELVDQLVAPPPPSVPYQAPCPQHCLEQSR